MTSAPTGDPPGSLPLSARDLALVVATAALYFIAARFGLSLAFASTQISPVWPAAGVALAALWIFGVRLWPGVALGAFFANLTATDFPHVALGIACGNTLEAVIAVLILRRLGFQPTLDRNREVFVFFIFAVLLSPVFAATIGVLSICLAGEQPWHLYGSFWRLWFLGDAVGMLIMAPPILAWISRSSRDYDGRFFLEFTANCVLMALVAYWAFHYVSAQGGGTPLAFLVFPMMIWGGLRLGPAPTAILSLIASMIAIYGTVHGNGPFSMVPAFQGLVILQLYVLTIAGSGLILAAATAERRRIQVALGRSEARMKDILAAANVGTWQWDIATGAVQWSDNMEQIHHMAPGSFGGTLEDFQRDVHPEDRDRVARAIRGALAAGGHYHIEYRQLAPDGETIWLEGKGQAFYDAAGNLSRMSGICMDVTERKLLENRLKELTDDLELQVRERTAVAEERARQLHAMALQLTQVENRERRRLALTLHDGLQQLLVGAQFGLSRIRGRAADRPDVIEATHQLDEILKQCIQASRSLSYDLSPPGLMERDLADAMIWLAHQMEEKHGLYVEVEIDGEPAGISDDLKIFLFQSVRELLFNVVKHAGVASARLRIVRAGRELRIEVSDEGNGFSLASMHNGEGSGLGLVSIQERINLLGGWFEIETARNSGTRFIMSIMIDEARSAAPDSGPEESGPPPEKFEISKSRLATGGPTRILLVDDHRMMRDGLSMLLREEKDLKIVGEAANGIEAIELARREQPDIIIMDVSMPKMDGIEAARRIHEEFPDIKIIGLSMHEEEGIARRMLESGVAVFLNKVGPSENLLTAIREQA